MKETLTPIGDYNPFSDPRFNAIVLLRTDLEIDRGDISKRTFGKAIRRIVFSSQIRSLEDLARADREVIDSIKDGCRSDIVANTIQSLKTKAEFRLTRSDLIAS